MPDISVVIPTYNQACFLREAIDSVFAQTLPPNEVLVVDDGSTDETSHVLDLYGQRIQVIRQKNLGVSAARNVGGFAASGDFLAFLDSDDAWLPSKLQLQMACFLKKPSVGLVHCGCNVIDDKGNVIGTKLEGGEGNILNDLLLFSSGSIIGCGSSALLPTKIFTEVGGYDTRLSTSADWDFSFRIANKYEIAFVRQILWKYRSHGKNMHTNIRVMEHDMLLAFDKAFGLGNADILALRRRAYGTLHKVLAGSFLQTKNPIKFFYHVTKSIWYDPANLLHVLKFPISRFKNSFVAI